jgi:hypothetical protein
VPDLGDAVGPVVAEFPHGGDSGDEAEVAQQLLAAIASSLPPTARRVTGLGVPQGAAIDDRGVAG